MFKAIRRIRKMTVALWAWCILIVVWAITGAHSATQGADCQAYHDACQTGAGIGVMLVLLVGFFGFVFLSLIWFMTRPKERR